MKVAQELVNLCNDRSDGKREARVAKRGAQRGAYGEHQWISIVSIVSLQ